MSRSATVPLLPVIARAHDDIRALASRLDLPGKLRAELHRIANGLLSVMLTYNRGN